ncbi:hypothetical protein HDV06_005343 [Boothiomyces sp. JEL0866]|nr:hypothetical protein HDV06_005343 [Boothiomyces sp. JEL0866]
MNEKEFSNRELFGSDTDDGLSDIGLAEDSFVYSAQNNYTSETFQDNIYNVIPELQKLPNGMTILKKEIRKTELDKLLSFVGPRLVNNQSMHFGPLPKELEILFKYGEFNQMIANYYNIGDGIIDHIDLERFDDKVLICSCSG